MNKTARVTGYTSHDLAPDVDYIVRRLAKGEVISGNDVIVLLKLLAFHKWRFGVLVARKLIELEEYEQADAVLDAILEVRE